jgi:L-gulono-1,4-lactone dehydrogenase
VNQELAKRGKALINMGAYDGQTLAGVISTSTHGSGVALDAFPGYVQAIILLAEDGRLYHIERSRGKGISQGPVRLGGGGATTGGGTKDGDIIFIQDDDHFLSAGVSMGCMGIIYAVVITVRSKYMLRETREFSWWNDIKRRLEDGSDLRNNRHLEVLVSPYPYANGDYKCMVTRRNIEPEAEYRSPLIRRGHRKWLPELLVTIVPNVVLDGLMRLVVNWFPKFVPALVRLQMNSLTDRGYIDKSYKVLNLGKYNNLAAFATEISLPANRYLAAVKEIIEIVDRSKTEGKQYLTAPFSLRFVKTNDFYLSMQYGHPGEAFVCMIEFPTISGAIGGVELLDRIESALYAFGGIPHWGQINHVGGTGKASVSHLYPRYKQWVEIYKRLSPCGRFENGFSRRCGISANE